jgi:methylisocitrate lyase
MVWKVEGAVEAARRFAAQRYGSRAASCGGRGGGRGAEGAEGAEDDPAAASLTDPDESHAMVVCARTDARGVGPDACELGGGMAAAVERAAAYTRAGGDMIFPEGLHSENEFRDFRAGLEAALRRGGHFGDEEFGGEEPMRHRDGNHRDGNHRNNHHHNSKRMPYLLANMTEYGKTPHTSAKRFGELGYDCATYRTVAAARYQNL